MSLVNNLVKDIGKKNQESLNYMLVLTNLLGLAIFLSNKNLSTKMKDNFTKNPCKTKITSNKNGGENIENKKELKSNLNSENDNVINGAKISELNKKITKSEDEMKTEKETIKADQSIEKISETEANIINFKKAKARRDQESNNKKRQLKKLVWRFPE